MADYVGGKYPVYAPTINGELLRVVYIDGTIKAFGSADGDFTFLGSDGQPLQVEDQPFAIFPEDASVFTPGRLLVTLAGQEGASEIVSTDSYRTWFTDREKYREMFGSMGHTA